MNFPSQRLVLLSLVLAGALGACGVEEAATPGQEQVATTQTATKGGTQSGTTGDTQPAEAAQFAGAKMQFESAVLDFGEVWDTDDMVGKFAFTNTGSETLVISEVKPSCGCTTTELSKMKFEPGESDVIELVWDPIGFGTQAKKITVRSNSGPGVDVLTIQARIKPFVSFEPQQLKFENLPVGQRNVRQIFMKCVDPNFQLLGLSVSNPNVTATHVGRRADGAYEIQLAFAEQTPWGQLNCSMQAKVRGKPDGKPEPIEHDAAVNVHATVFGDLRAQPTMFLVGHVLPGRNIERATILSHTQGSPFQVLSATVKNSKPPGMQVQVSPTKHEGKPAYRLTVGGPTGDYEGLIRGQVVIETDIPGEGPREMAVMGIVRP